MFSAIDELPGEIFTMLLPFFKINHNLKIIHIEECSFGEDGARLFALALGSCTRSLVNLELEHTNTSDEGMVDIITSLSMHTHLRYLDLDGNRMSTNGCTAMATLLQHSANQLQHLDISRNEIDDEGVNVLVPALKNCSHLQTLRMHRNESITSRGWQHLATILESPLCWIRRVGIGLNVDDKALAAFVDALINNNTLETLRIDYNASINANGWQSFSGLLCNPSTANSTFLSNHTLHTINGCEGTNVPSFWSALKPLLTLNARSNKKEVAIIKILQTHNDFDMMPFFEWEFKVLPLMIDWFERASAIFMPRGFEPNIGPRKLSCIYQFVRGMPLLYVETRLRQELEEIKAAQAQMEQAMRLNEERMKSIMERLGSKPLG